MRKSFTMLELIFVIVVIGILAGVAIPRLFSGVSDAEIAKVKSDVATVRTAISTKYGKNVMAGDDTCPALEKTPDVTTTVFENILTYPIKKNGGAVKWDGNGTDYNVTIDRKVIIFHYYNSKDDNCKFECNNSNGNCNIIGE
jgi:general secretion pathway protein G